MQHKVSYKNGKINMHISNQADWRLFEKIFQKINENFSVKIIKK
jgi:hypothetical protein